MKKKWLFLSIIVFIMGIVVVNEFNEVPTVPATSIYDEESDSNNDSSNDSSYEDTNYEGDTENECDSSLDSSSVTSEELENDPLAPSNDPADYNEEGQYVPADGPSDNPADYNAEGEYQPVEDMTQEEIEAEIESILGNTLGQ